MAKRGRPPYPDILTPREWEVLELLRDGLSNPEIAGRLGISRAGAKYHVAEILSKLALSSRQEAARWRPETGRPWWLSGFAPIGSFWRGLAGGAGRFSSVALGAAVVMALAVLGGLGLLAVLLLRDGTNETLTFQPYVPDGDRLAVSTLDGSPPVELTESGAYNSVGFDAEGRLLFVKSTGAEAGFYREDGGEPELVIALPWPLFAGAWSPDGTQGAWLEPSGDANILILAAPGDEPRTVGPEGLTRFRWLSDGSAVLAWAGDGSERITYIIHATGDGWEELDGSLPYAVSPGGDVLAYLEESEEFLRRRLVLTDADGGNRRDMGLVFQQSEGDPRTVVFSPDGGLLAWDGARDDEGEAIGVVVIAVDGSIQATFAGSRPGWSADGTRLAWSGEGGVTVAETGVWEERIVADGFFSSWSPDGTSVAYIRSSETVEPLIQSGGSTLYVRSLDAGDEVAVVDLRDSRKLPGQSAWSPDGRRLVVPLQAGEQQYAFSLDLETGEVDEIEIAGEFDTIIAPDGRGVLYPLGGTLVSFDPATPDQTYDQSLTGRTLTDWPLDGSPLLFAGVGLKALDLATGEVERLLEDRIQDAVWSPDRARIAFIREQRLHVLEVASGEEQLIVPDLNAVYLPTQGGGPGHIAWSPDGARIMFASWLFEEPITQGRSDIHIVDVDGGNLRKLTDTPRAKRKLAFSPDGRYLAYSHTLSSGDHLRILDVETGEEVGVAVRSKSDTYWVSDSEVLVNSIRGIAAVNVDGSFRMLVEAVAPCTYTVVGFGGGKVFVRTTCSHLGL